MIKQKQKKGQKEKKFHSLNSRLFAFMTVFAVAAFLLYFGTQRIIVHYVETDYLSVSESEARRGQYLENLQKFVSDRGLSSRDTADIARWVRMNPYVYLRLYRAEQVYFEAGYLTPEAEQEKDGNLLEESESALFPLHMSDGTIQVSLVDSTANIYYSASYIVGILLALLFFVIALAVYFKSVTAKITRLARDVSKIGAGEIDRAGSFRVKDEISLLSDDVNRMCDSLREKALKEREAFEANAGLITAMSHDLRTPLTVLMGYLDLICTQEELSEDTRGYLQTCKSTAERLKTLSDDMFLYFYVFGSPELKSSCALYSASVLLDQLLSEHMILLSEKNYEVLCDEVPKDVSVYADPALLSRVMDNLFSNFLKYADPAFPIRVEISVSADRLQMVFSNRTLPYRVAVESSGIGTKTCDRMLTAMGASYEGGEEKGIYRTAIRFLTVAPGELSSR